MTGSSKQLRSKTVGGDAFWTETFEGFMNGIADASAQTVTDETSGSAGVAGVVASTTSDSKYLQSAQGQEWTQLSLKKASWVHVFTTTLVQSISPRAKWMSTTL